MNISIPFNKVIPFKTSIAEILSISLEKDVSINDTELLGDFIVTGEYKNLDVNVDTMPFEHVIPFKVELENNIILDTLNYDIEDFSYEIIDNDSLKVNILLHVSADKNKVSDVIFEKEDDEDDRLNLIEEINNNEVTINNEVVNSNNVNNNIIDSNNLKEDYITYHVHIVKIGDTVDTLSSKYKIEKDKLLELNNISTLEIGDKIIIPDINE